MSKKKEKDPALDATLESSDSQTDMENSGNAGDQGTLKGEPPQTDTENGENSAADLEDGAGVPGDDSHSQTDIKNGEFLPEGAAGQAGDDESGITDSEIDDMMAEGAVATHFADQDGETDLESDGFSPGGAGDMQLAGAMSETDLEKMSIPPGEPAAADMQPRDLETESGIPDDAAGTRTDDETNPEFSQTDSENGENNPDLQLPEAGPAAKPKRSRAKKTAAQTETKSAKNPTSSGAKAPGGRIQTKKNAFSSGSGDQELPGASVPTGGATAAGTQPSPRQSIARTSRGPNVVAIDERRTVKTDADKMREDLLDLTESQKVKRLMSGTIQGVERDRHNPDWVYAVLYHGAFNIIIKAEDFIEEPVDLRNRKLSDVMHYLITKRLGAEIDYIIHGIDLETSTAWGSRLEAMAIKRRAYYLGYDRDGNNLLYEGISAEARVVSVIQAGIFVDLFGVETYVPLKELSYQRWLDATSHYQPGQRVLVKVLGINRQDRNNIRVQVSVKQAGENPYEKAMRRYTIDNRYVGTVSVVDTTGVFVSLDGGIDCLCSHPKRGRPPRGSRVTVRILGMDHNTNRIWGTITHMTTPR